MAMSLGTQALELEPKPVVCRVCGQSWKEQYPEGVVTLNAEQRGMLTVCGPCLEALARQSVAYFKSKRRLDSVMRQKGLSRLLWPHPQGCDCRRCGEDQ